MLRPLTTTFFLALLLGMGFLGCGDDELLRPMPEDEAFPPVVQAFGLVPLPEIPYPQYNPRHADRIALGRLLFFDPILSGESAPWIKRAAGKDPYRYRANDVACATCHHPSLAFADARPLGAGVGGSPEEGTALGAARTVPGRSLVTGLELGLEPRNSPTVLNAGLNGRDSPVPDVLSFQFLDGRVNLGLEAQAQEPLADRDEMAGDAYGPSPTLDAVGDSVVARLRNLPAYLPLFQAAFPGEIATAASITIAHVTKALAAYQRELVTPGSRYDRFVAGDWNTLNGDEKRGFLLFFGKGLCGDCHKGPMLSDYSFHVQGAGDGYPAGFPGKDGLGHDLGRFHANPEELADRKYAFRTLTVRNIALTAPYFHSGSAATLLDVIRFYNRGGQGGEDVSDATLAAAGVARHPSIHPLDLTDVEMREIAAFLGTLTGTVPEGPGGLDLTATPARVPSGLLPPGVATPAGSGPFWP